MDEMGLQISINGQARSVPGVKPGVSLAELVAELGLKADRIAVELNGEIAPRASWNQLPVGDADHLEIVHFVGGGCR